MKTMAESKLASWRRSNGFTLEDLSGLSGFSISYLSRVERGICTMTPTSRIRLSKSLGMKVGDLFDPIAAPMEASAA